MGLPNRTGARYPQGRADTPLRPVTRGVRLGK